MVLNQIEFGKSLGLAIPAHAELKLACLDWRNKTQSYDFARFWRRVVEQGTNCLALSTCCAKHLNIGSSTVSTIVHQHIHKKSPVHFAYFNHLQAEIRLVPGLL